MKTKWNVLLAAISMILGITACSNQQEIKDPVERPNPPVADTQLAGHWRNYYYYDGQFRITPTNSERQLWLEKDSTFQYFQDGVLSDKGTWSVGHTERYYKMNHNADYFKDSIVFVGKDSTIVRFFVYPNKEDGYRLAMTNFTPIEWAVLTGLSPEYWERMEQ